MLKSYEAYYENGKLNWLSAPPLVSKAKVIVVIDEDIADNAHNQSITQLRGIAPKPTHAVSLEDMEAAIQSMGRIS